MCFYISTSDSTSSLVNGSADRCELGSEKSRSLVVVNMFSLVSALTAYYSASLKISSSASFLISYFIRLSCSLLTRLASRICLTSIGIFSSSYSFARSLDIILVY